MIFFLPFDVLIRGKSHNSFTSYEAFHIQFSNGWSQKQNFTSLVRKIQVWESGEINNKKINEWMGENRRSGTWRNDSSGKSNRLWGHQHTHTFRTAPTSAIFFDVTGPLLWELERCSRRCQVRHAQYYYYFLLYYYSYSAVFGARNPAPRPTSADDAISTAAGQRNRRASDVEGPLSGRKDEAHDVEV